MRPSTANSAKRGIAYPTALPAITQSPDTSPVKNATVEPSTGTTTRVFLVPKTPSAKSQGKRKAEDSDVERTPPEEREAREAATDLRATLTVPDNNSNSSYTRSQRLAPSAFPSHSTKRARISTPPSTPGHHSRATSNHTKRATIDGATLGGGSSSDNRSHSQSHSRHASTERRSSYIIRPSVDGNISAMSMPLSAIVSPHAPSVARPSSKFHMQDPRKPQRLHPTSWNLHFHSIDEPGSPAHAWIFFIGFILFPLWWIASILPVPRTRHFGSGSDAEKLPLDDPQVEHDAYTWRRRCRWMAGVSLITYIPFVVLIAIFIPRNV